jgi:ribosomal protein S12 methylthiotransferase accessory factor
MTWYDRLPVREIAFGSRRDEVIESLRARIAVRGYSLHCFDIRNDLAIPSVWALAVRKDGSGAETYSGAAASLDPLHAARSAVIEAAANVVSGLSYGGDVSVLGRGLQWRWRLLADSTAVRTFADHMALYTLPEAFQRLEFLFDSSRERIGLDDLGDFGGGVRRRDVGAAAKLVLDQVLRLGMDVIVVDQTCSEQRRCGLRTVRVLVPGTLPMTAGHVHSRTKGFPRLLGVPVDMGYWSAPKRYEELKIVPHPFS